MNQSEIILSLGSHSVTWSGHSGYLLLKALPATNYNSAWPMVAILGNELIGSYFTNSWYNWQHLFKGHTLQSVLGRRRVGLPRTGCFLTIFGLKCPLSSAYLLTCRTLQCYRSSCPHGLLHTLTILSGTLFPLPWILQISAQMSLCDPPPRHPIG